MYQYVSWVENLLHNSNKKFIKDMSFKDIKNKVWNIMSSFQH